MKLPEHIREKIIALYRQMDLAYDSAAESAGFQCSGCEDNCCLTRFYHHTLLEYLYLKSGLTGLDPDGLDQVKKKAVAAIAQMGLMDTSNQPIRVMCPLNADGRCLLYVHRPMICRLHGVAHELKQPNGRCQSGPGCDDFYVQCGKSTTGRLDRTPFYMAMAKLEGQLRQQTGYHQKIRMTIADIIVSEHL